jgi:ribonucleoside-triphosphate reductase
MIDIAIQYGTSYFTFNILNCACDKCNHIEKRHFDVCPVCGSEETTDWTRIIGYLRPVKAFEKKRRIEASKRVYSKEIE